MIPGFLLLLLIQLTNADKHFEFDDIPIEHYDHADAESDAFDVELMPRSSRSLFTNIDRQNSQRNSPIEYDGTKLSDFEKLFENIPIVSFRRKRNAKFDEDVVKELGKPLELGILEPEILRGSNNGSTEDTTTKKANNKSNIFVINDYIRFRRSSEQDDMNKEPSGEDDKKDKDHSTVDLIAALRDTITEKLIFNPDEKKTESTRETRGASKEHWVKQPYFVQKNNDDELTLSNNIQTSTEHLRAPRVHFVTHSMEDTPQRVPTFQSERRARNWDDDAAPRNLARDLSVDMDYYRPRYMRNYAPTPYRYRNDRYYNPDPQRLREPRPYDRMYDYPERRRADLNRRQGRIIYYANLPEVPRASPENQDRERYDYRFNNRYYDDRYYSPFPYRRDPVPYPSRKDPVRPRYEERTMGKVPYTAPKDLSEGNGREAEKNPERRMYGENERGKFLQNNTQR